MDKVTETVRIFDKYAAQYQERYQNYVPYVATYHAFSKLLSKTHKTILDVACGPASFSRFLLDKNPALEVTGIDLAPAMIELARRNVPEGEFQMLDSRNIKKLGRKFDVFLLGFCLPYLSREETVQLLSEVSSMMSENGLLYLSTLEGRYEDSGYLSNDKETMFTYYHDLDFLNEQLIICGLEIILTERTPTPIENDAKREDLFLFARNSRQPDPCS
jgi:2-polyprenyl-3-methyl-5-hydroxy-6-metoxy-1,4-benzoquinol methylase